MSSLKHSDDRSSMTYTDWLGQVQPLAQSSEQVKEELLELLGQTPLPLPDPSPDQITIDITNSAPNQARLPQILEYVQNLKKQLHKVTKMIRASTRANDWVQEFRQREGIRHDYCYLTDPDLEFETLPPPIEQYNQNYCFWCNTGSILQHFEEYRAWGENVLTAYQTVIQLLQQPFQPTTQDSHNQQVKASLYQKPTTQQQPQQQQQQQHKQHVSNADQYPTTSQSTHISPSDSYHLTQSQSPKLEANHGHHTTMGDFDENINTNINPILSTRTNLSTKRNLAQDPHSHLHHTDDHPHRSLSTESAPILLSQSTNTSRSLIHHSQHLNNHNSNNNNNNPTTSPPNTHYQDIVAQLEHELQQSKTDLSQLEAKMKESERTRIELQRLQQLLSALNNDHTSLQTTHSHVIQRNEQLMNENKRLAQEIRQITEERKQLQNRIAVLQASLNEPTRAIKRPGSNLHAINDSTLSEYVSIGPAPVMNGFSVAAQQVHAQAMVKWNAKVEVLENKYKELLREHAAFNQSQKGAITGPKGGVTAATQGAQSTIGGQQSNSENGEPKRTHIGLIPLNPDGSLPEPLKGLEIPLVEAVMNDMIDSDSKIQWDDVAGLRHCKEAIEECILWPISAPGLFGGLRDPPKGILLFGPPGTGKTMLGKAIASQCNANFFCVSASSLTSKWYGQGEKMVKTLFAVCRYLSPCVLFIDEVDSVLTSRTEGEQEAGRRMKTEFLAQMQGIDSHTKKATLLDQQRQQQVYGGGYSDGFMSANSNTTNTIDIDESAMGCIVIAATNLPAQLDSAALRRFEKRLYVPLPGFEARKQLILRLLSKEQDGYDCTPQQIDHVARMTKGYSAADITSLCKHAALISVRELVNKERSKRNKLSKNTVMMGVPQLPTDVKLRRINFRDLTESAENAVKSSVDIQTVDQLWEFNKSHGSFQKIPKHDDEEEDIARRIEEERNHPTQCSTQSQYFE